jgi:hypothetical protein
MRQEQRALVLAALRHIYDGAWTRALGTDGGKVLSCTGKVAMLGAVTPAIDRHHAVMGARGERFLLYRPETAGRLDMGRRRLRNAGDEKTMREELADAATPVLAQAKVERGLLSFEPHEAERLSILATYVAAARTAVERDGYSHDVLAMPYPEAPGRLVAALAALLGGLRAIGASEPEVWRLTLDVAWGCVPDVRRRLLYQLRVDGRHA